MNYGGVAEVLGGEEEPERSDSRVVSEGVRPEDAEEDETDDETAVQDREARGCVPEQCTGASGPESAPVR